MRNILVIVGIIAAVIAIAAGVYFGTRGPAPGPAPTAVAPAPDKAALLAVKPTDHVLGDPKAPITMIEYASFTCPHCAHFSTAILPDVKTKWIDSGKVKLVYRDFPLDQMAAKAAELAECSGNERYFPVMEMIFATQLNWVSAKDPIAELSKSLRIAGMGEKEVKACLANEAVSNGVIADYKGGESLGVDSTPTFFINGQKFTGARPFEELDALFTKLTSNNK